MAVDIQSLVINFINTHDASLNINDTVASNIDNLTYSAPILWIAGCK